MIYSDEEMIMKDLMLAFGEELQKRFSGSTQTIEEMMAEMKKQQRKISNHERRIALLENRLIKFMARPDSVSQGKKSKLRIAGSDISLIRTRLTSCLRSAHLQSLPFSWRVRRRMSSPRHPLHPLSPLLRQRKSPLNRRKIPSMTFSKFSIAGIEWNFQIEASTSRRRNFLRLLFCAYA